jgi:dTDP-4-dehydrorhamnose reductase
MRRTDLDLARPASIPAALDEAGADLIVNCAAYTAVDQAEKEPGLAFAVNAEGPATIARWCADHRRVLIHLSTDYVFAGDGARPYLEDDPIGPAGVYGASKAEGERRVRQACPSHVILRTAWVYAAEGRNFVRTMLRLGATREALSVVADQRGCPTAAFSIAEALCRILGRLAEGDGGIFGTYHYVDAGDTTWYDFAQRIFAAAAERWGRRPAVTPITTDQYPTLAKRPRYSVLDTGKIRAAFGVVPRRWQDSLEVVLAEILGPPR